MNEVKQVPIRLVCIALASWTVAGAVWFLNSQTIGPISLELPIPAAGRPSRVSKPLYGNGMDWVQTFRVRVNLSHSFLSSGTIALALKPRECLAAIDVNGADLSAPAGSRCDRHLTPIDLSQHLRSGTNVVTVELTLVSRSRHVGFDRANLFPTEMAHCYSTFAAIDVSPPRLFGVNAVPIKLNGINQHSPYKIGLLEPYAQRTLLAIIASLGLGCYSALRAVLDLKPRLRALLTTGPGRLAVMAFLPGLGFLTVGTTLANQVLSSDGHDHLLLQFAAFLLPAVLLLAGLDRSAGGPFRLARCNGFAVVSVAAFGYASVSLSHVAVSTVAIQMLMLAGSVAGFLASVPLLPLLERAGQARRAVAIMLAASLCPQAYWLLRLPAWVQLSGLTVTLVRGILWVCGVPTTTFTSEATGKHNRLVDFWVMVSSSDFTVNIGSWCGGLEGVALFFFLLSCFILLDWPLFSRIKHLWAVYVLAVPFVLGVNVLRITGLFLYAEWYLSRHGPQGAVTAAVDAFHSNIGWVLYSLAFGLFLATVYWWAGRAARVK